MNVNVARVNRSGAAYLTPAVVDGRWMVRVSIANRSTNCSTQARRSSHSARDSFGSREGQWIGGAADRLIGERRMPVTDESLEPLLRREQGRRGGPQPNAPLT